MEFCCNPNNLYLSGSSEIKNDYIAHARLILDIISRHATKTQLRKIKADLQLVGMHFDEAKYLQAACESSVAASIALAYPGTFKYEPKLNPPSDVDCSFSSGDYTFNIEVKCPNYKKYHEHASKDCYSIGAMGRLDDYPTSFYQIKSLRGWDKPVEQQVHMDNKLKDYLISCQKKFSGEALENELNLLLVCCDSAMEMQKWMHYMYGEKGLLSESSYIEPNLYSKVDAVILTNLYHKHYSYWEKDKLHDHWSAGKSFNLIFKNISVKRGKDDAIIHLLDVFPNFSRELSSYELSGLEEVTRIPRFVNSLIEKQEVYYFQPRI